MKEIIVKWEVDDGYIGKDRPHQTIIDVEKYIMSEREWNSLSIDDKKNIIEDAVQEDYNQKVSFSINDYGI